LSYMYAVFGVMFLAGVMVLFFSVGRVSVFETVKLGETA